MLEIKKLSPNMWEDYIDFFGNRAFSDGNINKGCYCVWHHWTDSMEHERSLLPASERPLVKKDLAARLIRDGTLNGFAAYSGGKMIAFCNADRKDSYFRHSRENAPHLWNDSEDGSKTLAIVCFTVAPEMRGKGVATALLRAVCEYAAENGFDFVESYPADGEFSQENCCGNISMFLKQGFEKQEFSVRKRLK